MHHPNNRRQRRLALSVLSFALLGAMAMPAFAADPVCPDSGSTDRGIEDTAEGENATCDATAVAYGNFNIASGKGSVAMGTWYDRDGDGVFNTGDRPNNALGQYSSAFGIANNAIGLQSSVFGIFNSAFGIDSSAFGNGNTAIGQRSSAFGFNNQTSGTSSSAFGNGNTVLGNHSSAFGLGGVASGARSTALSGWWDKNEDGVMDADEVARATGVNAVALGAGVAATQDYSTAVGVGSAASGAYSSAFGFRSTASGDNSSALGFVNTASGIYSSAFGYGNRASGYASSAFGNRSRAEGSDSSAFGSWARAIGMQSTAIGYQAVAGIANVVSFGHSAGDQDGNGTTYLTDRNVRLLHVDAGIDATDAVNKGQLDAAIASVAGSGATANAALAAAGNAQATADTALTTANTALAIASNAVGASNDYTDTRETAIRSDMAAADADTLASANAHADAGDDATLTASKAYADTRTTSTLTAANAYTDQKFAAWNDRFTQMQQQIDHRFAQTDRRIDRIGAMGSAMTQMAVNAAISNSPRGRVAIGVGAQGGQGAVSIGYGKRIGDRGSFSVGASFGSGESSAGAGFGFDL